jgi:nucleotide-binding universal stress UspA family protein
VIFGLGRRRTRSRRGKTLAERGFRRIVVAVADNRESQQAVDTGCRLARGHGALLTLITVVEVPVELPLDCQMDTEDARAQQLLEHARMTAESYGVKTTLRLVRAREAATAIVDELERQQPELAIVGVPRRPRRRVTNLGRTVETVLKRAPCRVMLLSGARNASAAADEPAGPDAQAGGRA